MILLAATTPAVAQDKQPAVIRLNEAGPEAQLLAGRVGLWDVVETVWGHPGAEPVTTRGLVAERRLMGSLLQEFIRPPADEAHREVKRTDLLSFNRVEGRWGYVSFDTRVPVGLMPAWSSTRDEGGKIVLTFYPFALPGEGAEVTGRLLRMDQTIAFEDPDHDVKDQYFTLADGTGTRWLAHRYAYLRRP